MIIQKQITICSRGRESIEITQQIKQIVLEAAIQTGLCNLFIKHTSASLIISENADPDVHKDLEYAISRLAPDGDRNYLHTLEGADDMAAHIRSVLTQTSISIPVSEGRLNIGTWQGIFVWEHRRHAHQRKVVVTITGD